MPPPAPQSRNALLGRTPLILAVKHVNLPLARRLLHRGASIHATDTGGWPALHYAIAQFTTCNTPRLRHLLALLLTHGADLNATNACGLNAARLAATNPGCLPLLAYLVCAGASVDGVDCEGEGIEGCVCQEHVLLVRRLQALQEMDPRRALVCRRFERGGDMGFVQYLEGLM